MDDDEDPQADRLAGIQAAKDARLTSTPPPGMLWCHTGPHAVDATDMTFCPVSDLGIADYSGPTGPIVRRFCKVHFGLYLASQRKKDKAVKQTLDSNSKKRRLEAPLAPGMGRCCIGPHDVPIADVTFCPVADLGMTSYRGPKGSQVRRHCRQHFLANIEAKRKYKSAVNGGRSDS